MPDADWLVDYASSFPITAKMTSGLGGATSHIVQSVVEAGVVRVEYVLVLATLLM